METETQDRREGERFPFACVENLSAVITGLTPEMMRYQTVTDC